MEEKALPELTGFSFMETGGVLEEKALPELTSFSFMETGGVLEEKALPELTSFNFTGRCVGKESTPELNVSAYRNRRPVCCVM